MTRKSLEGLATPTGSEPVTVGLEMRYHGNLSTFLRTDLPQGKSLNHGTYSDLLLHVKHI